ncbi:hypothetical protein [Pseudoduganella violacea]|uniref:Uncharacterized protein n=1 Tax=Pseudoduganella violacea TaxID=1715466 RepID=A0A7W5FWD2_9BURK|nr:hypothetical protein [Pseudoduganella violacea]MBB3121732.1 hypothetical protein [Pseudoduganella violacea]
MMVFLNDPIVSGCHGATYTVIARSGQRGTEFADPRQAADAFYKACAQDRPFVLRNQANTSSIVAATRAGRKSLLPYGKERGDFQVAYEQLLGQAQDLPPERGVANQVP